jgi:hypothetical protein
MMAASISIVAVTYPVTIAPIRALHQHANIGQTRQENWSPTCFAASAIALSPAGAADSLALHHLSGFVIDHSFGSSSLTKFAA